MPVPNHFSPQAAQIQNMTSSAGGSRTPLDPGLYYGRVRCFIGSFTNTTGADIAINQLIALTQLPAGRILPTSRLYFSAFGSGATLQLGLNDYTDNTGNSVAAVANALAANVNVAAAGQLELGTVAANRAGINLPGSAQLTATVTGAVMPANAQVVAMFFVAVD